MKKLKVFSLKLLSNCTHLEILNIAQLRKITDSGIIPVLCNCLLLKKLILSGCKKLTVEQRKNSLSFKSS